MRDEPGPASGGEGVSVRAARRSDPRRSHKILETRAREVAAALAHSEGKGAVRWKTSLQAARHANVKTQLLADKN